MKDENSETTAWIEIEVEIPVYLFIRLVYIVWHFQSSG